MSKLFYQCSKKGIFYKIREKESTWYSYSDYFFKLRKWYFRMNEYPNLYEGGRYKNFDVSNCQTYIRLTPVEPDKLNLFKWRDFHAHSSVLHTEEEEIPVKKKSNLKKIGVFWLFAGENKREMIDHLFEFNNFLPTTNSDSEITYSLQLQRAPFNPITFDSAVINYSYFNILEYPGFKGTRVIDIKEVDEYSVNIISQLKDYIKECQLDYVVVGGFSQGGCMALHSILRNDEEELVNKVMGIVSLNGFLLDFTPISIKRVKALNFLLVNGLNDDIVTIREARDSYTELQKLARQIKARSDKPNEGPNFEVHEEPGLYHAFSKTGLQNTHNFIRKCLVQQNLVKSN